MKTTFSMGVSSRERQDEERTSGQWLSALAFACGALSWSCTSGVSFACRPALPTASVVLRLAINNVDDTAEKAGTMENSGVSAGGSSDTNDGACGEVSGMERVEATAEGW